MAGKMPPQGRKNGALYPPAMQKQQRRSFACHVICGFKPSHSYFHQRLPVYYNHSHIGNATFLYHINKKSANIFLFYCRGKNKTTTKTLEI
jgi:hypothetical protein